MSTMSAFLDLFDALEAPDEAGPGTQVYAAAQVMGRDDCFVGRGPDSMPCIIFHNLQTAEGHPAPVRLANLEVDFQLRCRLRGRGSADLEGWFTVVRCRSIEPETVRYFFTLGESLVHVLGEQPTQAAVARAVDRLTSLFRALSRPPARSLDGLFGELLVIRRSAIPAVTLAAWRNDVSARFDFSHNAIRLEVKTTQRRTRSHVFSFDQCNPPAGTSAAVASMFVERVQMGVRLSTVVDEIELAVSSDPDLVFKLHEVLVGTLGDNLLEGLSTTFDLALTQASLRFYLASDVPAIRGPLPDGVSEVQFRADLSRLQPVSLAQLTAYDSDFTSLLPAGDTLQQA